MESNKIFSIFIAALLVAIFINVVQINKKLTISEDNINNENESVIEVSSEIEEKEIDNISISDETNYNISFEPIDNDTLIAKDNMNNSIYSKSEKINPDFLTTDENGIPLIGKYVDEKKIYHTSEFASVGPAKYNFCEFKDGKFIHYNSNNERYEDSLAKNFHAYIEFCFDGNKDPIYKEISTDIVEDIFNYEIRYNDFYNTSMYYESDKLFQLVIVYYINF